MTHRVGIDIGGTFTDLVLLAESGETLTVKVASTPDDYSRGIALGLTEAFAAHGLSGSDLEEVIHGTTVATNAILEKRGVKTGLITTEGFRDILEIRRLRMPRLYDLTWQKPEALVARANRVEVAERIEHTGKVLRPLDEASVAAAIDKLLGNGVEAIAVTLINAYANDVHEQRVRELIHARQADFPVTLSAEVLPEIREYERTSTTVVNAYILPVVASYLRSLAAALTELKVAAPLMIMQSNGGAMGLEAATERPIHIIESGPAAGVVGAGEIAEKLGYRDVLTFDMGGTTAKAAMIEDGRFDRVGELDVGAGINYGARFLKGGGYHVSVPAIDIAEVGAGGGSLVRIDAGGALSVGPESAGAVPGPVCYDQGGETPTVTDANIILGFVNPAQLVGGNLSINADKAASALHAQISEPLNVSLEEAAFGVHRVANATMARALRAVSSERGRDPRRFALMAFGGNGPVHAVTLARLLDISTILVPPVAGVFSALGLLFPPTEHHYVRTFKHEMGEISLTDLNAGFEALSDGGRTELAAEGYSGEQVEIERFADLRYRGENTSLTVPADTDGDPLARLTEAFGDEHERTYGYRSEGEAVELVNLRVIARGRPAATRVPDSLTVTTTAADGVSQGNHRSVYFGADSGRVDTAIVDRSDIGDDWRDGPVIIEEYDSTTVVPPGCRVKRMGWDTLQIEVGPEPA